MKSLPPFLRHHAVRATAGALMAGAVVISLAACSGVGDTHPAATASHSAAQTATYQLHMTFFSGESKITPVIDPQVFVASSGAPAAVGPQGIAHVAGYSPAPKAADGSLALYGANGAPLGITLATWEKASGTVRFSCTAGQEKAVSTLTGLIPNAKYSVFVVHLKVTGAKRFTPWGNATGTNNTFTANANGSASPSDTVRGCLGTDTAAVVVWHSDGQSHGKSPGTLGVTWHNSLITPLP